MVSVAVHGMVVVMVRVGGHVGVRQEAVRHVVRRGGDVGVEPGSLGGGHEGREGVWDLVGGIVGGGHESHVGRGHDKGLSPRPLEEVHAPRVILHAGVQVAAALIVDLLHLLLGPGAHDAVDGAHGGDVTLVAHTVLKEPVAYLPGKDARVLLLVALYLHHHVGGGHFGLAPANHSRLNGPCLIVPAKNRGIFLIVVLHVHVFYMQNSQARITNDLKKKRLKSLVQRSQGQGDVW